jgi:GNAT superfamily N-acetyltransferase
MPLPLTYLEETALNAWPGLLTYLYDGWVVRWANGYTKRANSATPLYPGSGEWELEMKVEWCEQFFRARNLPAVFRLLPFHPDAAALDHLLAQQKYEYLDETRHMVLDLDEWDGNSSKRAYMLPSRSGLESWFRSFHALHTGRTDQVNHLKIVQASLGQKCPMVLMVEDKVVACGLGILQNDLFGLFDIVTDVAERGRGYGRELVASMLDWAIQVGASIAYLQVTTGNASANRLYARFGFQEAYRYWYRRQND